MSSQPKTKPETWVPAGAEKRDAASTTLEPPKEQRKQRVAMPPTPKAERRPKLPRVRRHVTNLAWAATAAAFPWIWFLVRDLTPVMQVVALALPAIVVAALVGLAISALDERRLSSLLVAISVAVFGWVTIVGPRSAVPSTPPVDPIRIASIIVGTPNGAADDTLATLIEQKADLAVVVEPSKKARNPILHVDRFPYTLGSGRFAVLSMDPVHELSLPKGMPPSLILRFQVDRPDGAFVVYAVRTDESPIDAALDDPIGIEQLRDAAADEQLPVVLIGDFGVSDRSTQYRMLVPTFRDAMRSGTRAATTAATFPWNLLFVRTGFVLTSPDWCSNAGATFSVQDAPTDGLTAAVGPCRR